jgi:hypothetical protein
MEKLLVTMTGYDPVEKLLPCLEVLVRPDLTVIFLFQYPVDALSYFRDHRIAAESARHATEVGRNVALRYDWEKQKELARQIIAPTINALEADGIQVEIELYTGSLAKAIKNYIVDEEIHWVVTPFPPRAGVIGYLSAKKAAPLGWSTHLLSARSEPIVSEKERQLRNPNERTGTLG